MVSVTYGTSEVEIYEARGPHTCEDRKMLSEKHKVVIKRSFLTGYVICPKNRRDLKSTQITNYRISLVTLFQDFTLSRFQFSMSDVKCLLILINLVYLEKNVFYLEKEMFKKIYLEKKTLQFLKFTWKKKHSTWKKKFSPY